MNRINEFQSMHKEIDDIALGLKTTLEATYDRAHNRWRKRVKAKIAVSVVICLIVCAVPLLSHHPVDTPLVVKVHAVSAAGQTYTANLSLGERVQLVPTDFFFEGQHKYYAFDLSLMDGVYLQLSSVDENWELILDKEIHTSGEIVVLPYWALTEGTDIAVIGTDTQGNVLQAYKDGSQPPRMKGSSMIWRVNEDCVNRCIIECFDKDFTRIVAYYLLITEVDGVYFAEVVNIV